MKKSCEKIFVVIPAYNESFVIKSVISEIQTAGYSSIVVVDDGSSDITQKNAGEMNGVIAIKHKINRGKGAATKTAIEAAKLLGADIIVTIDGDGQHDPSDISALIEPILEKKCDVTLGTRLENTAGMPFHKIIANHIGNIITWLLFGLYVTDSQSGFRAYSMHAANIINTKGDRYEYESEVVREIYKNKLKFVEVPIKVRYTKYSTGKIQKQGFTNGILTVYKMLCKIFF